ncbi:hypothetical protein [Blattabacterium cuenoti]|uniref:hypothetical protein n=1 Tax=Blattabacterium cuenoti TaxID=1653831 RepID=UPI00163B8C1E|nr:hypothetical protein [Blattabacterium cuenoti]
MKNVNFFIVLLFTFFSSVFSKDLIVKTKTNTHKNGIKKKEKEDGYLIKVGTSDINYFPTDLSPAVKDIFQGFSNQKNNFIIPKISNVGLGYKNKHLGFFLDVSSGMITNDRWKIKNANFLKISNGIHVYPFTHPYNMIDPYFRLGGAFHKFDGYNGKEYVISSTKCFMTDRNKFLVLDGGLGINFWIIPNMGLNIQSTYNHIFARQSRDYLDFWKHNIGLIFKFGNTMKINRLIIKNGKKGTSLIKKYVQTNLKINQKKYPFFIPIGSIYEKINPIENHLYIDRHKTNQSDSIPQRIPHQSKNTFYNLNHDSYNFTKLKKREIIFPKKRKMICSKKIYRIERIDSLYRNKEDQKIISNNDKIESISIHQNQGSDRIRDPILFYNNDLEKCLFHRELTKFNLGSSSIPVQKTESGTPQVQGTEHPLVGTSSIPVQKTESGTPQVQGTEHPLVGTSSIPVQKTESGTQVQGTEHPLVGTSSIPVQKTESGTQVQGKGKKPLGSSRIQQRTKSVRGRGKGKKPLGSSRIQQRTKSVRGRGKGKKPLGSSRIQQRTKSVRGRGKS